MGALARWQLGLWLNPIASLQGSSIPWGTVTVNLIGGYCIGVCVAILQAMPTLDPAWRLVWVTGFLGAFTTFSSFSVEVVSMLMQQRYALALSTTLLQLGGSLLLTIAGMRSARYFL